MVSAQSCILCARSMSASHSAAALTSFASAAATDADSSLVSLPGDMTRAGEEETDRAFRADFVLPDGRLRARRRRVLPSVLWADCGVRGSKDTDPSRRSAEAVARVSATPRGGLSPGGRQLGLCRVLCAWALPAERPR